MPLAKGYKSLRDYEGMLVRLQKVEGKAIAAEKVETVAEAQGLMFRCPAGEEAGLPHLIVCWFKKAKVGHVGDDVLPPGRWLHQGTTLDDIMFYGPECVVVCECGWRGLVFSGGVK